MLFNRRKRNYSYSSSRDSSSRDRRERSAPTKRRRRGGVFGLLGEFCRWFGFLMLVTGVVIGGAYYFLHTRFDEALRIHVEAKFRTAYPKHRVTLRAARRLEGQGIELQGLTIASVADNGVLAPIVSVEEMLLQCNASLEDMLAGKLEAKQVMLRQLTLHAVRTPNGAWSLAQLLPLPRFGSAQLPIHLESSTVEILWDAAADAVPAVLEIPSLDLIPVAHPDGVSPALVWEFAGTLSSSAFQQVAIRGNYDLAKQAWQADGDARGVLLSSEWETLVPSEYREQIAWLKALEATANARFQVTNVDTGSLPVRFQVEGDVAGSIKDPRLPFPLSEVKASFKSNGQSLEIQDATARVGQAALSMTCNIGGFREDAPCSLKLVAERLQVDRQLVDTLPIEWRKLWSMLAPEGSIDAEVSLVFDGQQLQHSAIVDCRDVSFAYDKFPYRLTNGKGRVEWRDDQLTFDDFRAYANRRPVTIRGEVRRPGPAFDGWVTVEVPDAVPIDEQLKLAIPESARRVVEQMQPFGQVTLQARFERRSSDSPILRRELTIGVKDCAVNYELFPYRLSKINGTISMKDGHWKVQDLKGMNDRAWVTCNGGWGPDESGVTQLMLEFNAQDVPLAEELLDALKEDAQRVWKSIRPRGTVDQIKANVSYNGQTRKTAIDLTAIKHPAAANIKEHSITIQPMWLPYRMDEVEGMLQCRNGVVELRNVRGRHSDTVFQLSGVMNKTTEGQWEVKLEPLNVDHVRITHELAAALPQRLSNAVTKLNVSGPFSLTGGMVLTGNAGETVPTSTQWDLEFDLEDGGVDCGVRLEHLHGGLKLRGGLDRRGLSSRGTLQVDSAVYKGIQFTQIAGPISLDDERLGFGEWSTRLPEEGPARPIQARVFGGTVQGSGEVKLSGDFPFDVESRLFEGNLATISREATSKRHQISGLTYADVRLQGNRHGTHTLRGAGNVQLRQADIYELPVMARLLKVLTISPPNATAFTSSDVKYHIEGDRMYFDKIGFAGDAISLDGQGEMTLDGNLNLTFSTMMGRDDLSMMILRPLLKEAGRRLVEIQVSGTLAEPIIDKRILPQLNDTLQTLSPNQQPAPNRSSMLRLPKPAEITDRSPPK